MFSSLVTRTQVPTKFGTSAVLALERMLWMWWAALAAAAAGGGADRKPATPTASGPERARSSQSSRAGAASSSSNWWSSLGTAARLDAQQEGPSELCQEVVESDPSSDDEASHTASTSVGRRLFDGPALHPAGVGN